MRSRRRPHGSEPVPAVDTAQVAQQSVGPRRRPRDAHLVRPGHIPADEGVRPDALPRDASLVLVQGRAAVADQSGRRVGLLDDSGEVGEGA